MVEFVTMAPTAGDSRYVGTSNLSATRFDPWTAASDRQPSLEYLEQIARAAEEKGFSTLLLPVGGNCLDSLVVASVLAAKTQRLKLLFAVRPGATVPAVLARQYATLDYLTGGRALINAVTGGSPVELAADGDFLDHDRRYHRTAEFIRVVKRLFTEEAVDHEGDFYRLKGGNLPRKPVQRPRPPIFFGGASPVAKEVAAREADVYMMWGETLDNIRARLAEMKSLESRYGRKLKYSVSFQVILGDTEQEARDRTEELLAHMDPAIIESKKRAGAADESVGHKRLTDLMEHARERRFWLGPNLWAGLTQVLGGNSIALVGTPEQVADRVVEYVRLGLDFVLLRGFPHLETIQQVGDKVIPLVRERLAGEGEGRVAG
ncbi:MAG: LLM class flavin-dependent oxidoreductase [Kyrpidia sp.]|nr:LLM class flavin-dependent oxidoreductase [Kyrpidia sp.]